MIWQLIGGFLARFWQPIAAAIAAWRLTKQRETIKDLKADKATRERIDNAPVHTDASDASDWLRDRADKRGLRRD